MPGIIQLKMNLDNCRVFDNCEAVVNGTLLGLVIVIVTAVGYGLYCLVRSYKNNA